MPNLTEQELALLVPGREVQWNGIGGPARGVVAQRDEKWVVVRWFDGVDDGTYPLSYFVDGHVGPKRHAFDECLVSVVMALTEGACPT